MASLSDFLGSGGSAAPDAAATLITRVHSKQGWFEYSPGTTLAAGKYVVKANTDSPGTVRVSGKGVGKVTRRQKEVVFELPEATDAIQMSYETEGATANVDIRTLPRFFPGSTNTSNWTGNAWDDTMATTPDGKVWIQLVGTNNSIRRSIDFGRTWVDVARIDRLVGQAITTSESFSIRWFRDRFIIAASPADSNSISITSPDGFTWQQISTNLATVISAATSPQLYVAGRRATSNRIVWSRNGIDFTFQDISGFTGNITKVFWDGTKFIAFEDGSRLSVGTYTNTATPLTWSTPAPTPAVFKDIVFFNNTYYAISTGGVLYSTPTIEANQASQAWTLVATLSSATNTNHKLRVWNNRIFYYDPNNANIRVSTNGTTWTTFRGGINQFADMNFLFNGTTTELVVVWNTNTWWRTSDPTGVLWHNIRDLISNVGGNEIRGVEFGNGVFVAAGFNATINTTTDARTWTAQASSTGLNINRLRFANGRFMYATNSGGYGVSTNGVNWNSAPAAFGSTNVHDINFGNGRWVAVGNTTSFVSTSDDNGTNWTQRSGQNFVQIPRAVAWGPVSGQANGAWVLVGDTNIVWRSLDNGVTWTRIDTLIDNWTHLNFGPQPLADYNPSWRDIVYANGRFVAVGTNITATSVDGLNWVYRHNNRHFHLNGQTMEFVRWDSTRNRFVMGGSGGYVAYSTDGTIWYNIPSGTTSTTFGYAADGTRALIVGASGVWRESTDNGEYFYHQDTDFSQGGTSYNIALGKEGYLLTNTINLYRTRDWNTYQLPFYNRVAANDRIEQVVYGNGVYVARASNESVWVSPNGVNWANGLVNNYTENVRVHNIVYAEGWFWGIYRPNQSARLFRSKDGLNWETYYTWHFDQQPPRWIKQVGNWMVAFGHQTGGEGRYYWYTDDILNVRGNSQQDIWNRGDTGRGDSNWRITDVAMTSWGVAFAYENNVVSLAPSLSGRASTNGSALLYNVDAPGTTIGLWHVWTVGDRMFGSNGSNLCEITQTMDQFNSTSTSFDVRARASFYSHLNFIPNGYHVLPHGNGVAGAIGQTVYIIPAKTETTFSLYNSTVQLVD